MDESLSTDEKMKTEFSKINKTWTKDYLRDIKNRKIIED